MKRIIEQSAKEATKSVLQNRNIKKHNSLILNELRNIKYKINNLISNII